MAQVVKSTSVWNFQDLLNKVVGDIAYLTKKYPGNRTLIEKNILDFLRKLPDIDINEEIKKIMEEPQQ